MRGTHWVPMLFVCKWLLSPGRGGSARNRRSENIPKLIGLREEVDQSCQVTRFLEIRFLRFARCLNLGRSRPEFLPDRNPGDRTRHEIHHLAIVPLEDSLHRIGVGLEIEGPGVFGELSDEKDHFRTQAAFSDFDIGSTFAHDSLQ